MDKNKQHNLIVFCDLIRSQQERMADLILQDICSGVIENPVDSWAWPYYQTFRLVKEYLKECNLWQTSYYKNLIK